MYSRDLVPLKNVIGMDNEPRNEAGVIILFKGRGLRCQVLNCELRKDRQKRCHP
jgi:hypothetical protein